MLLTEEAMARIDSLLGAQRLEPAALAAFRQEFPALSFTRCDLSDLGVEEPFREFPRFSLFLLDTSDHCSRLTSDPARATGLVVAAKPVQSKPASREVGP